MKKRKFLHVTVLSTLVLSIVSSTLLVGAEYPEVGMKGAELESQEGEIDSSNGLEEPITVGVENLESEQPTVEPENEVEAPVPTSGTEESLTIGSELPTEENEPEVQVDRAVASSGTWGTCAWDLSASGVLTIGAGNLGIWTDLKGITKSQVTQIVFSGKVIAPSDSIALFAGFSKAKSFENMGNLDTSQVINGARMFFGNTEMTTLDCSSFDTSNMTSMENMFGNGQSLTELDVSGFNTSNVINMNKMFYYCSSLSSIDVSSFDTSNVTDMNSMFELCMSVTSLDLSRFITSKTGFINTMFKRCDNLEILNIQNFDRFTILFLSGTPKLNRLTIGEQMKLANPNIKPEGTAGLLNIDTKTGIYTGAWVNTEGTKVFASSKEFMLNYNGATDAGTYVWQRVEGSPVTVSYVNENGVELSSPDTLTGGIGEAYETTGKEIPGYQMKETQGNATGTFSDTPQAVTYVYEALQGEHVTVRYEDTRGTLLETVTLTGKLGETFMSEEKSFAGYFLKTAPLTTSGTFTEEAQTLTYVYQGEVGAPITVNYINQAGNEVAASITLTGQVGMTYTAKAKTPYGFAIVETPENETGVFGTMPQTVTFRYQGNLASKLMVEFVTHEGKRLAPVTTLSGGHAGDAYTTEAIAIPGYTLTKSPANATGFRTQGAMTVSYVYQQDEALSFPLSYVGVQQQQVVGFIPEGVTATKMSLFLKKAGSNEWTDTGYSTTPEDDSRYFAIESRFVKGTQRFLLENKDQVKVVFTTPNGEQYEGIREVQPYRAPIVNDYVGGETHVTGRVDPGVNQVRILVNGKPIRVVNIQLFPTGVEGINPVTGEFSIWGKTWYEGSYGIGRNHETKAGDVITIDYGVQIYGALNNPSMSIEAN